MQQINEKSSKSLMCATSYESAPSISIVIPCFNYQNFVEHAIESVLTQSYSDFELIIIDDGSTDSSWETILRYKDRAKTVRTDNQGNVRACLLGLELSLGKFVYFLDADDMMAPGALEILAKYIQPGTSKIQFALTPIDQNGRVLGQCFPTMSEAETSRDLIASIKASGCYRTPPTSGNIYRRDVYLNLGDLSYDRGIDGVAYLLAPFLGSVVSLNMPLGFYRIHGRNLSSFSALDKDRVDYYSSRYLRRLRHLIVLLKERGLSEEVFEIRSYYKYNLELEIMRSVHENVRPRIATLTNYFKSVIREESGLNVFILIAFGFMLFLAPASVGKKIARIRFDQSYFPWFRIALKIVRRSAN